MILKIDKSFEKDFKKTGNKKLRPKLLATIEKTSKKPQNYLTLKTSKNSRAPMTFIELGSVIIGWVWLSAKKKSN